MRKSVHLDSSSKLSKKVRGLIKCMSIGRKLKLCNRRKCKEIKVLLLLLKIPFRRILITRKVFQQGKESLVRLRKELRARSIRLKTSRRALICQSWSIMRIISTVKLRLLMRLTSLLLWTLVKRWRMRSLLCLLKATDLLKQENKLKRAQSQVL